MIEVDIKVFFSFKKRIGDGGRLMLEVPDGSTVKKVLEELSAKFPGFENHVLDQSGGVKRFIQIRVNQRSISRFDGLKTKINDGDEILILPKLGGG